MMGLFGKVALISGAGSGLGEAAAISLAKAGAKVVLCGRRKERVDRVGERIVEEGGAALCCKTDVSDEQQVEQLVSRAIKHFGRIDILVNNAAVVILGQVMDTTAEDWDYQIKNNLRSVFLLTKACLPHMRAQKHGRIINITSSLSENGAGGYAAYGASKAAVEAFTRTAAEEENEYNILINLFNPGTIKTDMHATGQSPYTVLPELIRLAHLPEGGITGKLVQA